MDMMCLRCAKVPKNMSISSKHNVESLSTLTAEHLTTSRPELCAECDNKEQAEFFCVLHRHPLCLRCGVSRNKVCSLRKLDNELIPAKKSMDELTDNLGNAEQKYLQAINDLHCLLQRVDRSEQEDLAHVGLACDRLQQMVEDFRRNLKEMRQSSH